MNKKVGVEPEWKTRVSDLCAQRMLEAEESMKNIIDSSLFYDHMVETGQIDTTPTETPWYRKLRYWFNRVWPFCLKKNAGDYCECEGYW